MVPPFAFRKLDQPQRDRLNLGVEPVKLAQLKAGQ